MPKGNVYPRGYMLPLGPVDDASCKNARVPGDEEVITLYTLYMNQNVNTDSWSYRKRVLIAARRLFKNFHTFAGMQVKNEYLYGMNYDFLQDTYNFILEGKRKTHPTNWMGLFIEHPEPRPQDIPARFSKHTPHKVLSVYLTVEDILAAWCARPNGFEDMVCTLYVLFGNSLHKAKVSNSNCN